LWVDGFNGACDHLASRAALAVSSPDPPALQQSVAASRGWRFPMVSHQGTTFAAYMAIAPQRVAGSPGVSVFRREPNRILRVSDAGFRPGDDCCALWHLFDLLPRGRGRLGSEVPLRVRKPTRLSPF